MQQDNRTRLLTKYAKSARSGALQALSDAQLQAKALTVALQHQSELLQQRGLNPHAPFMQQFNLWQKQSEGLVSLLQLAGLELLQLRALAQTTAVINSSYTTDEVLNQVMDTVIDITGAERGYIVLKNPETEELEFATARGLEQEDMTQTGTIVISTTIVNNVADTGEAVLTNNASEDIEYQLAHSVVNLSLRSILAVPLKLRDTVIGVVYCDNRVVSGLFRDSELEVLKAFANQAAVAIENARLFEAVQEQVNQITEMRDLMDNILTSISSAVISIDDSTRILLSNRAANELLAIYDLDGLMLFNCFEDATQNLESIVTDVLENGTTHQTELQVTVPTMGDRDWRVVASPLQQEEEQRGVVLVIDDLTDQKRQESQMHQLQSYVPMALIRNVQNPDNFTLDGEERYITTIFADIRGFTTFSESREPEVTMEVINQYFAIASQVIHEHGGIVDKYLGDAVIGLFNTPLNELEQHEVRAVRTAQTIAQRVRDMHQALPPGQRLYFGIGVHCGSAVMGIVGGEQRREFMVIGEAIDGSKHLQEAAKAGEVILSDTIYETVNPYIDCEECQPHKLTREFPAIKQVFRAIL